MMGEGASLAASSSSSYSQRLNQVGKLFGQVFAIMLTLIGLQFVSITSEEKTHQILALAVTLTLYYMVAIVATMFQVHVLFMMVTSPLLGVVVVFIALMIISPMGAYVLLGLLIFITPLLVLCNKYKDKIYQMIPEKIKFLFERPGGNQNVGLPVHNFELRGVRG